MPDTLNRLKAALADRYRIERELGQGGMATVYLAEDVKHKRLVALKVLRPELAAVLGAERFLQEITTTASLQHPHILPLFDSGEAAGFLYYVMPYIEGETLRQKLDRETQLGVEEAVKIAVEVADALEYAHTQGVIHRDIKPENILLHAGRPMVADFGIALAVSAAAGGRMTETGLSLGTPHYMSPEQATADRDITSRSDIYSLGSVLYEMLAGDPPHTGSSAQQIIMKIVTEEAAPVTKARKAVPPNVAAAVATALEKLPADRFASPKQFAEALANPGYTTAHMGTPAIGAARRRRKRSTLGWAALLGLTTLAAAWGWLRPTGPGAEVIEFYLDPPDWDMAMTGVALSPDGRRVIAEIDSDSGTILYQRTIDDATWRPIPGTARASSPFFSPDGGSIGLVVDGAIRWMPITGGSPRTVTPNAGEVLGITWGPNQSILFASAYQEEHGEGLRRVPVAGGPVELLTTPDSTELAHWLPNWVPNTDVVLFETVTRDFELFVTALSLSSGRVARLGPGISPMADARGNIIYLTQDGSIVVQRFDAQALRLVGEARIIAERVRTFSGVAGFYALGHDGSLLYQSRQVAGDELLLVDRQGEIVSRLVESTAGNGMAHVRFAPSGDRVAYVLAPGVVDRGDLWVYSLTRQTGQRLTFEGDVADPAWTPDGRSIGFSIVPAGEGRLAEIQLVAADGTGPPRRLLAGNANLWQGDFGTTANDMVMRVESPGNDIAAGTVGRDSVPIPLMRTQWVEEHPVLSPDGRWLAYKSNETGRDEVYVRSYPDLGPKTLVSIGGGGAPAWGGDGRTLYYEGRSRIIEAALRFSGPEVIVTRRTPLFRSDWLRATANRSWDVSLDGQRFVVIGGQLGRTVWRVNALAGVAR